MNRTLQEAPVHRGRGHQEAEISVLGLRWVLHGKGRARVWEGRKICNCKGRQCDTRAVGDGGGVWVLQ